MGAQTFVRVCHLAFPNALSPSSQRSVGHGLRPRRISLPSQLCCFHRLSHNECRGVPQIFPGVVLFHSDTHFPRLLSVCSRLLPLEQVNLGGVKGRRFCSFQEHNTSFPRDFPFTSVMYSLFVIYSVEVIYFQFSMLVMILRNLLFFYQTILSVKKKSRTNPFVCYHAIQSLIYWERKRYKLTEYGRGNKKDIWRKLIS